MYEVFTKRPLPSESAPIYKASHLQQKLLSLCLKYYSFVDRKANVEINLGQEIQAESLSKIFVSPKASNLALGPKQSPTQMLTETLLPRE